MNTNVKYRIADIDQHKENDLYFYLPEIIDIDNINPFVDTSDHGRMLMFGSYSYLGLLGHDEINKAASQSLNKYGTGTHGARMLSGTLGIHKKLESAVATFVGTDDALVFNSGFLANISIISVLVSRHDLVICDMFSHASIIDGCRLSGARLQRFEHNNSDHLAKLLQNSAPSQRVLVVVDGVYSMDGDIAMLPEISKLCKEYGALLMVDEAHSLGVIGKTGRGIEEHFDLPANTIDVKMGTLSKAIPSIGGYIAGCADLIEELRHNARGFVYTASLPAASAAAALKALEIIENEPDRIAMLHDNVAYLHKSLRNAGFSIMNTSTAITPVVYGDSDFAFKAMMHCVKNKIFVQAIVSPVVPDGSSRLRATVTSNHKKEHIDNFLEVICETSHLREAS